LGFQTNTKSLKPEKSIVLVSDSNIEKHGFLKYFTISLACEEKHVYLCGFIGPFVKLKHLVVSKSSSVVSPSSSFSSFYHIFGAARFLKVLNLYTLER
jgi:hypothetical protein